MNSEHPAAPGNEQGSQWASREGGEAAPLAEGSARLRHSPAAVLEQVEQALAASMVGSNRSSNGRMGAWATPTMQTMEMVDDALKALRSLRRSRASSA